MNFRLLAITQEAYDPAVRYRLGHFIPLLNARGIEVETAEWPKQSAPRWPIIERARQFDAVVVFRRLMPLKHLRALRKSAKYLAFDFDDCVTRRDSALGYPWPLLDKVIQFRAMIGCVDAVTAGNQYLAELARSINRSIPIDIVPTTIDLRNYPIREAEPVDEIVGWIGQKGTLSYLAKLQPALATLCANHEHLRIRTIGVPLPLLSNVRSEFVSWSSADEVKNLHQLSVGLAPLPDDPWTRGKCGLRLLQYLAAGVPAVAAPVGVQREIIDRGAALPARTMEDWADQVNYLLFNTALREQVSRMGRELVEREFVPLRWIEAILRDWCARKSSTLPGVESPAA
jgi:glycosyltransferase involved in cell wall biosynthesis